MLSIESPISRLLDLYVPEWGMITGNPLSLGRGKNNSREFHVWMMPDRHKVVRSDEDSTAWVDISEPIKNITWRLLYNEDSFDADRSDSRFLMMLKDLRRMGLRCS